MPRRIIGVPRTCEQCGSGFKAASCRVANGEARYCSLACKGLSSRMRIEDRLARHSAAPDPDGCVFWTGDANRRGYGVMVFKTGDKRARKLAHRVSYESHFGPIPEGMFVCHHCDNPGCIAPDHLFLGTDADNSDDKCRKGRQNRGERHGAAKLTEASIEEIRSLYGRGGITQAELSARFNVDCSTISLAVRGKTWSHL